MIATGLLLYLIIQVVVLSGLAFIFNRTIKSPGLQKLNRFTVITLLVCVVIFFRPLLAAVNILELAIQSLELYSYTAVIGQSDERFYDLVTVNNQFFLLLLIKPFISPLFWLIASCISLLKIRKEKCNEALPTPS